MPQNFLAVDIGAESGRLMSALWDGRHVRLHEIHRFENGAISIGDSLRWDLLHLWSGIRNGLSLAHKSMPAPAYSIGVDTWALDYVLVDNHNEWLGLPYCYRDARTRGMVDEACARLSRAEIFAESGLQFMEINTLYQLMATQRSNPALLQNAYRLLMIPDWINWALCGSETTEFTNATTTQLVHPRSRKWSATLPERLGIPSHFLPEIAMPGTELGNLRSSLAEDTGLSHLRVIAPATHDTASAVVSVPVQNLGHGQWAYISSGTWSLVGVEVSDAVLTTEVLDGNFTNEGGVESSYRLLKNVMGLWLLQQLRRSFGTRGAATDYGTLVQTAAQSAPLRSLIDPDDARFLRPTDMVRAVQDYCRQTHQPVPEGEGALVRCVLESLALRYRDVLAGLEQITGKRIEVIHIVGGGSRNVLLNQFTADACQRPVIAGPVEATALGNALIQARTAGELGSVADIRTVVRDSFAHELRTFEPDTDSLAVWEEAAARWRVLGA